jgi:hypothetical protein
MGDCDAAHGYSWKASLLSPRMTYGSNLAPNGGIYEGSIEG